MENKKTITLKINGNTIKTKGFVRVRYKDGQFSVYQAQSNDLTLILNNDEVVSVLIEEE